MSRWRVLLGVALLILLVVVLEPAQLGARLASVHPLAAVLAVTGLVALHLVPAAGWRWILASGGIRVTWGWAARTHYQAQALGSITPANLGADVHRTMALRTLGTAWGSAVASVVVQRATSYLALAAVGTAGVVGLAMAGADVPMLLPVALAVSGGAALLGWLLIAPRSRRPAWLGRLADRMAGTSAAASAGPMLRRGVAIGLGQGLAFHVGAVVLTWLLVLAIEPVGRWEALSAVAVARLALAVPLTPSGLGIQEGALAVLLAGVGLDPAAGLAALVITRVATVATGGIGALLMAAPAAVQHTRTVAQPHE